MHVLMHLNQQFFHCCVLMVGSKKKKWVKMDEKAQRKTKKNKEKKQEKKQEKQEKQKEKGKQSKQTHRALFNKAEPDFILDNSFSPINNSVFSPGICNVTTSLLVNSSSIVSTCFAFPNDKRLPTS